MLSRVIIKQIVECVLSIYKDIKKIEGQESNKEILQGRPTLFITPDGQRFYKQVQEYLEYTGKGIMFVVLPKIVPIFVNLLDEEFYTNVINQEEMTLNEKELLTLSSQLMQKLDIDSIFPPETFFNVKDLPRMLGGLILSIYSFNEVFVDSLADRVLNQPNFAERFLKYQSKKPARPKKKYFR